MNLLIILAAKYLIALPVLILLWCYFALRGRKRRELIILSVIALPLSLGVGYLAGHLYYNARPFVVEHTTPLVAHAANNGFPSDHMLLAATIAMLGWYVSRRLGIVLWLLAVLVGFSRVAAGIHHSLDIVGSALIALVVVSCSAYIAERIRR